MNNLIIATKEDLEILLEKKNQELYERLTENKVKNPTLKNLLKSKDVCEMLGISQPTLIKYRKKKLIHEIILGRKVFFDPERLDQDIQKLEGGKK